MTTTPTATELDVEAEIKAFRVELAALGEKRRHALFLGKETAPIYAEIGEIFAGLKKAPIASTTVFKSVGLAIEDVAAAKLVYSIASGNQ